MNLKQDIKVIYFLFFIFIFFSFHFNFFSLTFSLNFFETKHNLNVFYLVRNPYHGVLMTKMEDMGLVCLWTDFLL